MKRTKREKKGNVKKFEKQSVVLKKTDNKQLILAFSSAIVTFLVSIFFIPTNAEINLLGLKSIYFYFISFSAATVIFYGLHHGNKTRAENSTKYFFLVLLTYSIIVTIIPIDKDSPTFIEFYQKILAFQSFVIFPAVATGFLAIFQNKQKLNNIVNNLFAEKTKKEPFIESVKNLFSKREVLSTSILFIIIGISIFTLFYRLDYFDLYSDEAQVTQGAAGYYHTGEFKYWDFVKDEPIDLKYDRAWPHLFLMAKSYDIFGISNWSSRFPSAFFGVLLIILSFFVGKFFLKDNLSITLIILSFVFYFEFLLLQRWGRMYAIIIPLFLLSFYFGYKFLTSKNIKFRKKIDNNKLLSLFDFNYLYLFFFLVLVYFNFNLHINTLLLLLVLYLYSILLFIISKDKKYLNAIILGIVFMVLGYFFVPNVKFGIQSFISLNGGITEIYNQFFFGYPFSLSTNLVVLVIGSTFLFFVRNRSYFKIYLYIFLTVILGWFLFTYMIKYAISFRYMSFIAPVAIFLIVSIFTLLIKTLYNKPIRTMLIFLLILSVLNQFSFRYNDLYVRNFASPARPSIAWKTIVNEYKKPEIIYRHWGPSLYFSGIDTAARFLELGGYEGKPFKEILDTLKSHESGWLSWHTQHTWRMDTILNEYANLYFEKHHGYGVDDTGVEVFYFTDSMLRSTEKFQEERLIPLANFNLENTYSIAFWLEVDESNNRRPFTLKSGAKGLLTIKLDDKTNERLLCKYDENEKDFIKSDTINLNTWHHVVWYQEGGNKDDEYGFYIDGALVGKDKLNKDVSDYAKFRVNRNFGGKIDDIRVYNQVLTELQIRAIIESRGLKNTQKLIANNEVFETLFHWQKR